MLARMPFACPLDLDPRAVDQKSSGALLLREAMSTTSAFWRRHKVLKSGSFRSRPINCSRLSTKPIACRSARPDSTFILRHAWIDAALKTC